MLGSSPAMTADGPARLALDNIPKAYNHSRPCSQRASSRVTFDGGAGWWRPTMASLSGAPGGAAPGRQASQTCRMRRARPGTGLANPFWFGARTEPRKLRKGSRKPLAPPGAPLPSPIGRETEKGTQASPGPSRMRAMTHVCFYAAFLPALRRCHSASRSAESVTSPRCSDTIASAAASRLSSVPATRSRATITR
jgi:hypothetical protein